MVSRRTTDSEPQPSGRKPATTPEGRENQMIALAVDLAEKQFRDGTASAQVISHYLKLGSSREKLEQERIARENELLAEKAESMRSAVRVEQLYMDALNAMRTYAGQEPREAEGEYED